MMIWVFGGTFFGAVFFEGAGVMMCDQRWLFFWKWLVFMTRE